LHLGDLLCAVPALRALRHLHSHAEITLVGLPWAKAFVERYPAYLDRFISFPGFPELPEAIPDLAAAPGFLEKVQERRFDFVIQMHGDGTLTDSIALLFGASRIVGFYRMDRWCPQFSSFWSYPEREHEIHRNLSLIRRLGAEATDERLEFPLGDVDRREWGCRRELETLRPGKYVCLHPGARSAFKRWAPAHFAQVGGALTAQGFDVVLTGSAAEWPIAQAVASAMSIPSINAA
jgi:ADP-heptose:LPS heptosyltransferase